MKGRKLIGFIALAIAMFIGMLDSTIINIALPDIMEYFNASLNDTSWISTIYVLGLSVCMIPASKLADQFGRKKIMLTGLLLFGLSSALCGLSGSLFFLISMRLIQGIGGALITPIVVPMALELYGREKTQMVAGAVGAISALAAAGGPPIGGLLIKYINWQFIFFVNVPFVVISLFLTLFFIRESYDKTISRSIDWLGILFLSAALFLLTFSLLKGSDYGWSSSLIISMFVGSAVSMLLFIVTESMVKAPLIELKLFKEKTFTASSICYMITGFGIVSPVLIFNYFLQNALGYEALDAAYIVMSVSLTVIVTMPLGSLIAGKLGARLVNFFGVFSMGIGAALLSRLTVDTSKTAMIIDMIVFGFGLGFSCQSLVSSIKHLPEEKCGIGSGIVNAARQIGTCIGIALLVSILNTNVSEAKDEIKEASIETVNQSNVVTTVKSVMLKDIKDSFSGDDAGTSTEQKKLENKMEEDIKEALSATASVSSASGSSTIKKLYDGVKTLNEGSESIYEGQSKLNSGISALSSGLDKLETGSTTLSDGVVTLQNGLSQTLEGAETLDSASDEGIDALSDGIEKLDGGMQQLLTQFYSGIGTGNTTIYDGVTGVEEGTLKLSDNLGSYVSAVNNMYYLMIQSNPASATLLEGYKNNLSQLQLTYIKEQDKAAKEQYLIKIKALSSLVTLYTAGTDSSVTNEQQFEEKLISLAGQSASYQNVVAAGNNISNGAKQLKIASSRVAGQFKDGGALKEGFKKTAAGSAMLHKNTGKLLGMKQGIDKLTEALTRVTDGSSLLVDGSKQLKSNLAIAQSSSEKLISGSKKLTDASLKIKDGTETLSLKVGLIDQKGLIEDVVKDIKDKKDEKIAGAFEKTFLIAAIILIVSSVCGLFTDRKDNKAIQNS